ncbi:MAG TPA: tRNA lysidine(34) synthetase TilS [Candidatus Saccharimonadales bacterium]|nr:tRNA lysidine(34) synthetase TilS [Candidatus Saccharimonadales bacterium]
MEISLPKDKTYIVAISGGVDSMVLLDLLVDAHHANNWNLVIAHVDHGIRSDSGQDKDLVATVAKKHNLVFEFTQLSLGEATSEQVARVKRYEFLDRLARDYKASAIVTAHHEDDLIETAIINIIRGTGRKGLTSLVNNPHRLRPLISYSKADIISYARKANLVWREDTTNADQKYLRNYIRINIIPKLNDSARSKFVAILNNMSILNLELDDILDKLIKQQPDNQLDKLWFSLLPNAVAKEVLAAWFRHNNLAGFNKLTLERLVVSAKVARVKQRFPIYSGTYLIINKSTLSLSK